MEKKKKKIPENKTFILSLIPCEAGWDNKILTIYRHWIFTLDYLSIFPLWTATKVAFPADYSFHTKTGQRNCPIEVLHSLQAQTEPKYPA